MQLLRIFLINPDFLLVRVDPDNYDNLHTDSSFSNWHIFKFSN